MDWPLAENVAKSPLGRTKNARRIEATTRIFMKMLFELKNQG